MISSISWAVFTIPYQPRRPAIATCHPSTLPCAEKQPNLSAARLEVAQGVGSLHRTARGRGPDRTGNLCGERPGSRGTLHLPIKPQGHTLQGSISKPLRGSHSLRRFPLNTASPVLHPQAPRSSGFSNPIYHRVVSPKSADAPLLWLLMDRFTSRPQEMPLARSQSSNSPPVSVRCGKGEGKAQRNSKRQGQPTSLQGAAGLAGGLYGVQGQHREPYPVPGAAGTHPLAPAALSKAVAAKTRLWASGLKAEADHSRLVMLA